MIVCGASVVRRGLAAGVFMSVIGVSGFGLFDGVTSLSAQSATAPAPDQAPAPARASAPAAGQAVPQAPSGFRATRDTYDPLMDVLKASRPRATDAQLQRLKEIPIEAVWAAVTAKHYQQCFVTDFKLTQPQSKVVGRALTMRYLPVRPDVMDAVMTLAKEGDWDFQYNVRAGEDVKPGDLIVVELGGAVDRATFMGDVTGLGIRTAGATGVVIDGGLRDLSEFLPMKDLPVYYRGSHASAMADQVGVAWNVPVRLGGISVLPGDIVIGDASGVLAFPPQIADEVIAAAEETIYTENFKREMMHSHKYRARDIYPKLSPEMEKQFEAWKKTHPKAGVKPVYFY
jgi:4-hydroxy-4-methyl-2-oxoglutarate aldolase